MKIEVLYFDGCPNHKPTLDIVRETLEKRGLTAEVCEVEILGPEDALERRFLGSPSVRIDGVDVEPEARDRTDYGFSCRTYAGGVGIPPLNLIEAAIESSFESQALPEESGEGNASESLSAPRTSMSPRGLGLYAAAGTFSAAALSSACCWLPLILIGLGVSVGGLGAFFESMRPAFLGLTAVLLVSGFYVVYLRKPKCESGCATDRPATGMTRINKVSLWVSTLGAVLFALFPYYVGLLPLGEAQAQAQVDTASQTAELISIPVVGMTCVGCAATIEQAFRGTPGVVFAKVDFERARLDIRLDARSPASRDLLLQTLRNSGFDAGEAVTADPVE